MSTNQKKMLELLDKASESLDKARDIVERVQVLSIKDQYERNRAINNYLMVRCIHDQIPRKKNDSR